MNTKKLKTTELIGAALDWAVNQADIEADEAVIIDKQLMLPRADSDGGNISYSPSTDWAQGGPIIERENIALYPHGDGTYEAEVFLNPKRGAGPTPLIAAMRCYVASKLGDEVEDHIIYMNEKSFTQLLFSIKSAGISVTLKQLKAEYVDMNKEPRITVIRPYTGSYQKYEKP